MSNYIMIYRGESTDTADMTQEQAAEVMARWGAWIGAVGSALIDIGAPFGAGISVVDDGTTTSATALSGYSVVEADSLDAARALSDGHPYLSEGAGNFAIEIFELTPVPFES